MKRKERICENKEKQKNMKEVMKSEEKKRMNKNKECIRKLKDE